MTDTQTTHQNFNIKIENVKSNKKTLKFDIKGDKKYGFSKSIVNGIRRVLLSEIPTVAIDTKDINIVTNNGKLHNEFLKDRISLIPLYINPINYKRQYIFKLSVKITDTQILNITADMFDIYKLKKEYLEILEVNDEEEVENLLSKLNNMPLEYYDMDTKLNSKEKEDIFRPFKFRNYDPSYFLITELKNTNSKDMNEEIELYCSPSVNISKNHARWNNIPLAVYTFKKDALLLEKTIQDNIKINNIKDVKTYTDDFIISNSERYFHKDDNLEPYWYDFSIQSNHIFNPKELINISIDLLINKLNFIGNNLLKLKNTSIDGIDDEDEDDNLYKFIQLKNENTYCLSIDNENDTMGNIIQSHLVDHYINDESFISLCGYKKPHPLKNNIIFNFMTNPSEDSEQYKKMYIITLMINVIKDLIEIFNNIKNETDKEL